jgi:hypothetical protein
VTNEKNAPVPAVLRDHPAGNGNIFPCGGREKKKKIILSCTPPLVPSRTSSFDFFFCGRSVDPVPGPHSRSRCRYATVSSRKSNPCPVVSLVIDQKSGKRKKSTEGSACNLIHRPFVRCSFAYWTGQPRNVADFQAFGANQGNQLIDLETNFNRNPRSADQEHGHVIDLCKLDFIFQENVFRRRSLSSMRHCTVGLFTDNLTGLIALC